MKKIFILFLAFASVNSVFAQSRKIDETRRVINGESKDRKVYDETGSRYPNSSSYPTSRQEEIDQINREYDRRINAVRMNRVLSSAEKERRIRELEMQRDRRIREITNRNGNYSDNQRYKKNKNRQGNNGKHLGWEKGVGNPHRTGNNTNENDRYERRDREDDDRYENRRNDDRYENEYNNRGRGNGNGKGRGKNK